MEQELKQGRKVINRRPFVTLHKDVQGPFYIYSKTNSKTMHEMISTYIHNNHNIIIALWNGWMLFTPRSYKKWERNSNERDDVVWNLKT